MARRQAAENSEPIAQPPLIKLTDDEKLAAGEKLADLWRARRVLKNDHALAKKEMTEEADRLDRDIDALASMIRTGGR
jgi:hypothetical protein